MKKIFIALVALPFFCSCLKERRALETANQVKDSAEKIKEITEKLSDRELDQALVKYKDFAQPFLDTDFDCSGDVTDFFAFGAKESENLVLNQFPISLETESEYGQEFHKSIQKEYKMIDSDSRRKDLVRILNKMLPFRERKDINYQIHLLDDDMINAFAIVGGHIYITTALLDFVDSEDELAVIIGHELGHNDKKHTVRKVQKIAIANNFLGGIGVLAANIQIMLTSPFGQVDEYESDRMGAYFAKKAGYNPRKGKDFFIKLKDKEKYSLLDKLRRSHPYSHQREKCLESYISEHLD